MNTASRSTPYAIAILVAAVVALYWPILGHEFVWDDTFQIVNNKWLTSIFYIPDIFTSSSWGFFSSPIIGNEQVNTYRPLNHLTFMMEHVFTGANPVTYHFFNILFHSFNAILAFFLARHLLADDSRGTTNSHIPRDLFPLLTAVIFAIHPINTEAVSWASTIVELTLATMFLSAFYLYITDTGKNRIKYVASLVLFFIALFQKEPAVTLLPLIILYDCSRYGIAATFKRTRLYLPYLAAIAIFILIRAFALGSITFVKQTGLGLGGLLINIPPLLLEYVKKIVYPASLSAHYDFTPITDISNPAVIYGCLLGITFLLILGYTLRRNRAVFIGLSIFIVPLLPAFSLPAISASAAFAERYLYISSFGFALLLSYALQQLYQFIAAKNRSHLALTATVVLACLCLGSYTLTTIKRIPVWSNNVTLWQDVVAKNPDNVKAHYNLGAAYMNRGLTEAAINEHEHVLKLAPTHSSARLMLGREYLKLGQQEKGYYNLSLHYLLTGKHDLLIKALHKLIAANPKNGWAHLNLGQQYLKTGHLEESEVELHKAIRLSPRNAAGYNSLAILYINRRQTDDALMMMSKAIRLDPRRAELYFNLGNIYLEAGKRDLAARAYKRALMLNRKFTKAQNQLDNIANASTGPYYF